MRSATSELVVDIIAFGFGRPKRTIITEILVCPTGQIV